ncbi:hypothetical protein N7539_005376 [Penicillium diatomitis]|uniref:Uncharacterized protein n=1 Tax=Penicillium diatomitis TaxID=2819901 RepID=A0A9W9X6H9_9EURO|nr:uncharacterized protein N7539_005376 [Penicillium diatomitis]KAJ5485388.1 hypothetical protein N7539_005376 [Penicillium diatomitis]
MLRLETPKEQGLPRLWKDRPQVSMLVNPYRGPPGGVGAAKPRQEAASVWVGTGEQNSGSRWLDVYKIIDY